MKAWISCLMLATLTNAAFAQVNAEDEYVKKIDAAKTIGPLDAQSLGENVDLYSGAVEFEAVDVSLPGNNGIAVEVRRTLSIQEPGLFKGALGGFGDWSLNVPYIDGIFSAAQGWRIISASGNDRCTALAIPNTSHEGSSPGAYSFLVWNGYSLNIPGEGKHELLANTRSGVPVGTSGYPWVTTSRHIASCLSSTKNYVGEGFLVHAPNGVKYTFDYILTRQAASVSTATRIDTAWGGGAVAKIIPRNHLYLVATKVEDRFGNSVNYDYVGEELRRIYASDGREIVLSWNGGKITTITAHGRSWSYAYRDGSVPYGLTYALSSVIQPDGSAWIYASSGELRKGAIYREDGPRPNTMCQYDPDRAAGSIFIYSITSPSAATGSFKFSNVRHHRTKVPTTCVQSPGGPRYPDVYAVFHQWSLMEKNLTGPGVPSRTWSYGYGGYENQPYYRAPWPKPDWNTTDTYVPGGICSTCSDRKVVQVTGPSEISEYEFGITYAKNEGRLLAESVRPSAGSLPSRRITYEYLPEEEVADQAFVDNIGKSLLPVWERPMVSRIRPVYQRTTNQQGVNFTWRVESSCGAGNSALCFDAMARPIRVTKSSSPTP